MQKAADAADISVLFFSAGANYWVIFGPFWQFWVIFGPIFRANFFVAKIALVLICTLFACLWSTT